MRLFIGWSNWVFTLCCVVFAFSSVAQPARIVVSAGTGLSYISHKNVRANYTPVTAWHGGISTMVNVNKDVLIETGLAYERRGFRLDSAYHYYSAGNKEDFYYTTKAVRHYITLPLQMLVKMAAKKNSGLYIGGGMNYGLLIKATAQNTYSAYLNGSMYSNYNGVSEPKIGVLQVGRSLARGKDYIHLYAFDIGIKAQAVYFVDSRYMLRAYYNYSLYDTDATLSSPGKQRYRQHSTGVSVGIVL